jgi:hypothetical protein
MPEFLDYPLLVFLLSFLLLWFAAWIGAGVLRRRRPLAEDARSDFDVISAATLTLLGLIIGFTFSMAISRYDQRKAYEEEEANAIGTQYLRAELLPGAAAERMRALLRDYAHQRIVFYTSRDADALRRADARTAELQNEMWAVTKEAAAAQPTPIVALAVAGMNDVLNSQGYTQAAWWNRIPAAAWLLMIVIAVCCNILVGYGARSLETEGRLLTVLPLVAAVSFFLIADIDSPRAGVIRVKAQNIQALQQTLR